MPVTDKIPGLSVYIEAEGRALQEYRDPDIPDTDSTITRYIGAVTDKEFIISYHINKGTEIQGDVLDWKVLIDGQVVSSWVVPSDRFSTRKYDNVCKGVWISEDLRRNYRFSNLEVLNDNKRTNIAQDRLPDLLGSIVINVTQSKIQSIEDKILHRFYPCSSVNSVSEKSIKGRALSHSISFSEPTKPPRRSSRTYRTKAVNRKAGPCASFVFLYRSIESLKSMLIIPRTPSPAPLEDRDFDTLTREELRELHRRARDRENVKQEQPTIKRDQSGLKRERNDDGSGPRKMPRQRLTARPRSGNVQLELGEDGEFRETVISNSPLESIEIIDLA